MSILPTATAGGGASQANSAGRAASTMRIPIFLVLLTTPSLLIAAPAVRRGPWGRSSVPRRPHGANSWARPGPAAGAPMTVSEDLNG